MVVTACPAWALFDVETVRWQWGCGIDMVGGGESAISTLTLQQVTMYSFGSMRRRKKINVIKVVFLFLVTIVFVDCGSEGDALRTFYSSLGGDDWTTKAKWMSSEGICKWEDIVCDGLLFSVVSL